ncbi:MAG: hypothetical protein CMLOHMNK_02065 [Steroidobacteraceae bacterium]|nr:hypothetical protein [Steroidobacteraceae bacterium]
MNKNKRLKTKAKVALLCQEIISLHRDLMQVSNHCQRLERRLEALEPAPTPDGDTREYCDVCYAARDACKCAKASARETRPSCFS